VAVAQRSSFAEDEKLTAKLTGIRASVTLAESEMARLREEFNVLLKKREELQANLVKLKDEDKVLQRKIMELKGEEEALHAEVAVAEHNSIEHQKRIQSRLRSMYVNKAVSSQTLFSSKTDQGAVERMALYARKVRDMDARVFQEARTAVAALVSKRQALAETLAAEQSAREELIKKRKVAEAENLKLKAVSEQLTEKQQIAQQSLALLRDEAKKVEEMIASLTSGDIEVDDEDASDEDESDSDTTEAPRTSSDEVVSPPKPSEIQEALVFPSIFDPGVRLYAPVKGEVLQGFGRSKVSTFADMVFSKGVDFSAPGGGEVHAVLGGKVAFLGTMPGYEQVLVLEHGSRSYSLYGRLGQIAVKQGDVVKEDQVIATTSEPDAKGRNFYFEIRKSGAPINPQSVLKVLSRER
jgi:septal ring factor EnvC (AmiA/AmiB activator)